jgi:hypothetical protein
MKRQAGEAVPKIQFLEQLPWICWKYRAFGRYFQELVSSNQRFAPTGFWNKLGHLK